MALMLSWNLEEHDVNRIVEELHVNWPNLEAGEWLSRNRHAIGEYVLVRASRGDDCISITPNAIPFCYVVTVFIDRTSRQAGDMLSPSELVSRLCALVGPAEVNHANVRPSDITPRELSSERIDESDRHPMNPIKQWFKKLFNKQ